MELIKKPVRMEHYSERYKLDPASRVNYTKIYTIEHNIKVKIIGKIHEDSKVIFFTNFKRFWDESDDEKEENKSRKGQGDSKKKKGGK
jgi:septum formation inhibitor-activating ATPase MinD